METMILVDKDDRVLDRASRKACHQFPGKLHRAVLVIIKDKNNKILLAKRGKGKLWQGIWDGTVATHVYSEETPEKAAKRGVEKELGLNNLSFKKHGFFVYQARWKDIGVEHEVCHLFTVQTDSPIKVKKNEITDLKWAKREKLEREIKKNNILFTPWFLQALKLL